MDVIQSKQADKINTDFKSIKLAWMLITYFSSISPTFTGIVHTAGLQPFQGKVD